MLAQEVLSFMEENDVKFIRLAFLDLFGRLKNIAIQPDQLGSAFETGIPFDATAVDGFSCDGRGDLLLRPDPDTLCILPWRPQAGRVCRLLCDVLTPEGEPYAADPRGLLRAATARAADQGLMVRIGSECEFYLFEADENGTITKRTQDHGGYMDVAPMDRGEDVRREICLTLDAMNIHPESSHHERGPGQNEVDFHRADPVTSADHLIAFHNAVRTIAARYGLRASFMPKPLETAIGNSLHINLSFYREGANLFRMENGRLGEEAAAMIAGVLNRLPDMTLFLNPLPNSYDRLSDDEAPNQVAWSTARGRGVVRVPLPQHRFARMQITSADPTCNAYLADSLLIDAALEGLANREVPPAMDEVVAQLPQTLSEAAEKATNSAFIARALPSCVTDAYRESARDLCERERSDRGLLFDQLFQSL